MLYLSFYISYGNQALRWCESFVNSQSIWLNDFQSCFSPQIANLPTLEDIQDGWRHQLHAQAPQNFAWGTFVSLHELLYDVFLSELIVRVPKFLCGHHPSTNMQFNPMPLQSFLMSFHLYQLRGVTYFGGQHFVAYLVEQDTTVWFHDGIITGRNIIYESQLHSVNLKHCHDGKKASALFYTCILYQL